MSVAQGRTDWEKQVAELERKTLSAVDRVTSSSSDAQQAAPPAFDAGTWTYTPTTQSANVNAFLDAESRKFEREIWGGDDQQQQQQQGSPDAALLPLYVPRVSLVEALHVSPAEPRATDAFKFNLPSRPEELSYGGPEWNVLCRNAMEASSSRIHQSSRDANNSNERGGGAGGVLQQQQQAARRMHKLVDPGLAVDFIPIIIVPGGASAVVQLANVRDLLENGIYSVPHQKWMEADTGETRLAQRDASHVFVSPSKVLTREPSVKFRQFRVVDDPALVDNWNHVCAAFVSGQLWQFEGWFGGDPSKREPRALFDIHVKGFLPFFEDETAPPEVKKWKVVPLQLSRRSSKAHMSLRVARIFWEQLFEFMETHPLFRRYTQEAPRGVVAG